MKSRLDCITDWDHRLRDARWQAKALARACQISEWELRHYVRCRFGEPLHEWIRARRMEEASARLKGKAQVKNVWIDLGYKQASHFSRDFKRFYGVNPSAYL